jgi:hypothetical protein
VGDVLGPHHGGLRRREQQGVLAMDAPCKREEVMIGEVDIVEEEISIHHHHW